jgi:predicted HicB family RNase H-like nuclease
LISWILFDIIQISTHEGSENMNTTDNKKAMSLRLDPEMHKKIKFISFDEGITMQKYIIGLIDKDIKRREKANNEG